MMEVCGLHISWVYQTADLRQKEEQDMEKNRTCADFTSAGLIELADLKQNEAD